MYMKRRDRLTADYRKEAGSSIFKPVTIGYLTPVGANNERARDRSLYKKAKQELKTVNREYPLFVTFKLQKKAHCSDETSIHIFSVIRRSFFFRNNPKDLGLSC